MHTSLINRSGPRLGRWAECVCALLLVFGVGCSREPAVTPTAGAPRRPNILFIFTDDQAPGFTGYEGNRLIRTPNIDRLSAQSFVFTRAYCPTGMCAPSRALVLTGQYPHVNGVQTNGNRLRTDIPAFSGQLKAAGYRVGLVGKWHVTLDTEPIGFGFEESTAISLAQDHRWIDPPALVNGQLLQTKGHLCNFHTNMAIDFIKKKDDRPFLLWLCYRMPHHPFEYPPGMSEKDYPPEKMPLPISIADDSSPLLAMGSPVVDRFREKSADELRRDLSKYYAMMEYLDGNVGRVLSALDRQGLGDDTVVIFASDNGFSFGEHRLYSKGECLYEEMVRCPMMIRHPDFAGTPRRIDRVVNLMDLAPTICELAGAPIPETMQARSLLPLIAKPDRTDWLDEVFLEFFARNWSHKPVPMRGVVTRRYKYVRYLAGPEQLFDLQTDPHEMHNLIDQPAMAETLRRLQTKVADWRRRTNDPVQG